MKGLLPVTLFALAGAASACTFAVRNVYSGDDKWHCSFAAYLEDDANIGDDGGTGLGNAHLDNCERKDFCETLETEELGEKYEFCVEGSMGKDGKVDGKVTVKRDGGGVVNIKSEKDGQDHVEDNYIAYWRNGIECPGAHRPKPQPTA